MGHSQHPLERGVSTTTPPLHFSATTNLEIKSFVVEHHYSHRFPCGTDYPFKIEQDGRLVGACTFGVGSGNKFGVVALPDEIPEPGNYRELTRLVLLDEVPRFSETKFVAWCLRWLNKHTELVAVVSFADPEAGHLGTIYRAGNWILIGKPVAHCAKLYVDGVEIHPRTANARYGTSKLGELKALGVNAENRRRYFKYKFAYPIQPWVRSLLEKRRLVE